MLLVVVRHGKAEERSDSFGNDRARPLTQEGIEKMHKNAKALKELAPNLQTVVASPLVRAQQTAEIIKETYGIKSLITTECLSPGMDRSEVLKFIKDLKSESVCIVGHEPDLGEFCSWLLSGNSNSFIPFRKGGVCALEFQGAVLPKTAHLVFKFDPRHL